MTNGGWFDANPGTPETGESLLIAQFTVEDFMFSATADWQGLAPGATSSGFMVSTVPAPGTLALLALGASSPGAAAADARPGPTEQPLTNDERDAKASRLSCTAPISELQLTESTCELKTTGDPRPATQFSADQSARTPCATITSRNRTLTPPGTLTPPRCLTPSGCLTPSVGCLTPSVNGARTRPVRSYAALRWNSIRRKGLRQSRRPLARAQ